MRGSPTTHPELERDKVGELGTSHILGTSLDLAKGGGGEELVKK